MEHCSICDCPQETAEGAIDLVDGKCDACRDHIDKMNILMEEIVRSGDFDYSMN